MARLEGCRFGELRRAVDKMEEAAKSEDRDGLLKAYMELSASAAKAYSEGLASYSWSDMMYSGFGGTTSEEEARALAWDGAKLRELGESGTIEALCRHVDASAFQQALYALGTPVLGGIFATEDEAKVRQMANWLITACRRKWPKPQAAPAQAAGAAPLPQEGRAATQAA